MAEEQKTASARSIEKANPRAELVKRKITKVLAKESPSGAESVRTKYLWPHLKVGMTVEEWHTIQEVKEHGGIPTIYIVELVRNGHIEVEPPLAQPA